MLICRAVPPGLALEISRDALVRERSLDARFTGQWNIRCLSVSVVVARSAFDLRGTPQEVAPCRGSAGRPAGRHEVTDRVRTGGPRRWTTATRARVAFPTTGSTVCFRTG